MPLTVSADFKLGLFMLYSLKSPETNFRRCHHHFIFRTIDNISRIPTKFLRKETRFSLLRK